MENQWKDDHEFALRLAQETNGQVNDINDLIGSFHVDGDVPQCAAYSGKNYELSDWSYSELRDTINTSSDIELLEACQKELLNRRLKVYHAWKERKKRFVVLEEPAPHHLVLDSGNERPRTAVMVPSQVQRYFRIPFVDESKKAGKRGYWYAHFVGQWIARQMEVLPEKPAVLLKAGCDDDGQMCDLTLAETGLTQKRGAEIREHEFELEWQKQGGTTI